MFHSEEQQSVFHQLNHTQTNGGREHLRYLLNNPLDTVEAIMDTQQTIRQLMDVSQEWPITVTNGTVMVMERFYESQVSSIPIQPNKVTGLL